MVTESQRGGAIDEYEGGDDDIGNDPFYAELTRQVLLLTAEDEGDGDFKTKNILQSKDAYIARERWMKGSHTATILPGNYFSWSSKENNASVPSWLVNLWKTNGGGGTGVFIPHIVKSGRRNKPKKNNRSRGRRTKSSTGEMQYNHNFKMQG